MALQHGPGNNRQYTDRGDCDPATQVKCFEDSYALVADTLVQPRHFSEQAQITRRLTLELKEESACFAQAFVCRALHYVQLAPEPGIRAGTCRGD